MDDGREEVGREGGRERERGVEVLEEGILLCLSK